MAAISPARRPSVEEIAAALVRSRGGRMTTARRSLLGALGHPSAEELLLNVRRTHPDVDGSTVYRNLAQLEALGIVIHVHLAHGPAVYHLAGEDHAHIVCSGCGMVAEIPGAGVAAVREALAASGSDFGLTWQHFAWTGLCGRCAETPRSPGPG